MALEDRGNGKVTNLHTEGNLFLLSSSSGSSQRKITYLPHHGRTWAISMVLLLMSYYDSFHPQFFFCPRFAEWCSSGIQEQKSNFQDFLLVNVT